MTILSSTASLREAMKEAGENLLVRDLPEVEVERK